MTPPTTRLVSLLNIPELGEEILREGWPHFVETQLHREREWFAAGGVHKCRFLLHAPGFAPSGQRPPFDQWLQDTGNLPRLRDGFAEAWGPVVEDGHEVICYLGPLRWLDAQRDPNNPAKLDNSNFRELAAPYRAGDWLARVNQSLAPALAGRCSVAFESLGQVTPRHPAYHLIGLLQSQGTRCYIEPTPGVSEDNPFAHWYAAPKIVDEQTFSRHTLPAHAAHFSGELIRVCGEPATNREAERSRLRQILSDGHTAAFRVHGSDGVKGAADLGIACEELLASASLAGA